MGTTSDKARGNLNRFRPNHPPTVASRLRELWDVGKTASQCAVALVEDGISLSRSAVCAIARRKKFPSRPPAGPPRRNR